MVETALARMMVSAFHDSPAAWDRVARGMRDAMVEHARRQCDHWARVAPPGTAFEEIPPLTKAIMRSDWDALLARGFGLEDRAEGTTSGSSGEPSRVVMDVAGIGANFASVAAMRTLTGIPPHAWTGYLLTQPQPTTTFPEDWLMFSVHDLSPAAIRAMVATWSELEDYFLWGRASAFAEIAAVMHREGLRPARQPVAVVTSQDALDELPRRRLREVFGCDVRSWYGSKETCPALAGTLGDERYAFNPLMAYVEIVDDDAQPVPPGQVGRVLVTDLHNRVMPMIRYDMQDLAVLSAQRHGAWPILERLEGRSSEVLRLPSGRTISSAGLGVWIVDAGLTQRIRGYQCLQRGANHLELRIVWQDGAPAAGDVDAARRAVSAIADPDTCIDVVGADALETLPSGKGWIVRREPGVA